MIIVKMATLAILFVQNCWQPYHKAKPNIAGIKYGAEFIIVFSARSPGSGRHQYTTNTSHKQQARTTLTGTSLLYSRRHNQTSIAVKLPIKNGSKGLSKSERV